MLVRALVVAGLLGVLQATRPPLAAPPAPRPTADVRDLDAEIARLRSVIAELERELAQLEAAATPASSKQAAELRRRLPGTRSVLAALEGLRRDAVEQGGSDASGRPLPPPYVLPTTRPDPWDYDGDGLITPREAMAVDFGDRFCGKPFMARRSWIMGHFARLDANRDGLLDRTERAGPETFESLGGRPLDPERERALAHRYENALFVQRDVTQADMRLETFVTAWPAWQGAAGPSAALTKEAKEIFAWLDADRNGLLDEDEHLGSYREACPAAGAPGPRPSASIRGTR